MKKLFILVVISTMFFASNVTASEEVETNQITSDTEEVSIQPMSGGRPPVHQ